MGLIYNNFTYIHQTRVESVVFLFNIVNSWAVYLTRSLAVQTAVALPSRPSDICFISDVFTQIVTCLGRTAARWRRQQLLFSTPRLSITVTDTHTYGTLLFYTLLSNFYHNPQIHFRSLSFIHIFFFTVFHPLWAHTVKLQSTPGGTQLYNYALLVEMGGVEGENEVAEQNFYQS